MATVEASPRWTRPASVPFPRVWRRCTGHREVDGRLPKFTIQDVPDDMHEEVVTFMSTYFTKDETICANTKLWMDPVSMQELQDLWRRTLRHRVAVVALLDDEADARRIVGCNVLAVLYKADRNEPNTFKGEPMRKFVDALNHGVRLVDPYDMFDVEEAIVGLGLSIDPSFRGQGLGLEIMRTRFDLGRTVGLRLTYTVFTAIQSQVLAAKVGMETLAETIYDEYKKDGKVIFPGAFPRSMKLMARVID